MSKAIKLLRSAFWIGAALDSLNLIPMLFPKIGGYIFRIQNFSPGPEYIYAMYFGAALMAGWTVLLIWADRKPLERKGILLITVFPVIIGIMLAGIYGVSVEMIELKSLVPTFILQISLIIFFLFSYFYARSAEKKFIRESKET